MGEEIQSLEYDGRLAKLEERKVGLWDVIASASRRGSLDHSIREAAHNRIEHLLNDFPDLKAIAFNGATASLSGRRLIGEARAPVVLIDLPSSSAANTRPFVEKATAWSALAKYLQP